MKRVESEKIEALETTVLESIEKGSFSEARECIERLFSKGHFSPAIIIGYSICLAHDGEEERARQVLQGVRVEMREWIREDHVLRLFEGTLKVAESLMPGKNRDRKQSAGLLSSAEMWMPKRSSKKEKKELEK